MSFPLFYKMLEFKIPKQSTSLMNTNLCTSVCRKSYSQMRLVWYGEYQDTSMYVYPFPYWSYNFANTLLYFCLYVFVFVWELSIITFLVHFSFATFLSHNYSPGCYSWTLNLSDLFSLVYLVSYNEVQNVYCYC